MALIVSAQLLEAHPLKVKFFTAGYSPEVDRFLNEELEKFLNEDLTKFRSLHTAPAIFISSGKDILIAAPYKEVELSDEQVVSRIVGMEEEELQSFSNWEETIRHLQKKGYTIGTEK